MFIYKYMSKNFRRCDIRKSMSWYVNKQCLVVILELMSATAESGLQDYGPKLSIAFKMWKDVGNQEL